MGYFYSGLFADVKSGIVIKKHIYTMWDGKLFQGIEILTPSGRGKISISDLKNVEILQN